VYGSRRLLTLGFLVTVGVECEARHAVTRYKHNISNNINSILDSEYFCWGNPTDAGDVSGEVLIYEGITGVHIGLLMTRINAIKVFKK
jgi:hypothetical protein